MPQLNLKRVRVLGDGNCGFNAIALGLLHYFVGLPMEERQKAVEAMWQRCDIAEAIWQRSALNVQNNVKQKWRTDGNAFFFTHYEEILHNHDANKNYQQIMAGLLRNLTIPILIDQVQVGIKKFFSQQESIVFYFPTPFGGLVKYADGKMFEYQPKTEGAAFVSGHYEGELFVNDEHLEERVVTNEEKALLLASGELFQYYLDLSNEDTLLCMPKITSELSHAEIKEKHQDYLIRYFNNMWPTLEALKKDKCWVTAKTITVCADFLGFSVEFRSAPEEFKEITDPRTIKILNRGGLHGNTGLHFELMVDVTSNVRPHKKMKALKWVLSLQAAQGLQQAFVHLKHRLLAHGFFIKTVANDTSLLDLEGEQDEIQLILHGRWPCIQQCSKTGQSLVNSQSAARLFTTILTCKNIITAARPSEFMTESHVSKRRTVP